MLLGRLLLHEWPWQAAHGKVTELDVAKLALTIVAGIGGVVALTVAYRRQHQIEENTFLERFGAAATQLGSTAPAVRLAGAYAMASVADDSPYSRRQQCIDALCAYLRLPYVSDPEYGQLSQVVSRRRWSGVDGRELTDELTHQLLPNDREVRHTIIRIIRDHLVSDAKPDWHGHTFDFTGSTFDGGDFSYAHFDHCIVTFDRATFVRGEMLFFDAVFTNCHVTFDNATFAGSRVSFMGIRISDAMVRFDQAKITGGEISFYTAKVRKGSDIRFFRTEINGGSLTFFSAKLTGGSISIHADIAKGDVTFYDTVLRKGKLDFSYSTFDGGEVGFDKCRFAGTKVNFSYVDFEGSDVTFASARFAAGKMTFKNARFRGGTVSFNRAQFAGTQVSFKNAEFSGGVVDISSPRSWDTPPGRLEFEDADSVPDGLHLPRPNIGVADAVIED